jgi:hypothetical protein
MGTRNYTDAVRLDALVDANTQFHWGTNATEIEEAASRLRALNMNAVLASELDLKAGRIRTIRALLAPEPIPVPRRRRATAT